MLKLSVTAVFTWTFTCTHARARHVTRVRGATRLILAVKHPKENGN